MADNSHDLERFLEAQEPVYSEVVAELRGGRKRSHWMWFIFPQMRGLGLSSMAHRFGIASVQEARAYWLHPVLGPRLLECTKLVLAIQGKGTLEILGGPDDMKFKSCMTLFEVAASEEGVFVRALVRFFAGERDDRTLELLSEP
jgi:uncharacterized protein (DUF1810 family)